MTPEKLLADLIGIKSYSGEEAEIREYIQLWFEKRGVPTAEQGENLLVHLEGEDRSRAFLFNSHIDTVTAGDSWTHNPWNPTKVDDKFIGLGASDMKSGLTASMLLAQNYAASGRPPVDAWFTYVVKEEIDGSGTQSFADWFESSGQLENYTDLAAIFTEPNSMQEVEHGHRGNYFLLAEATGQSGHASRPDKLTGELATKKMFAFSQRFQEAVTDWRKEFPDHYFDPSLTLGEMTSLIANARSEKYTNEQGQEALRVVPGSPNKFPENCIATFDLRTTPQTHELVYPRILEIGKQTGVRIEQAYAPAPAGFTHPTEKIVMIAASVNGNRTLTVSQGSADLGFLTTKGIKSVILGPGEKDQCHLPDEFCFPTQIPFALETYKQIVAAWGAR